MQVCSFQSGFFQKQPGSVHCRSPDYDMIYSLPDWQFLQQNHQDNNQILKDIYGADALLPTTAEMHIGNFGQYLDLLPGIEKATFDKKNYDIPK